MGKIDKKKEKLAERIKALDEEIRIALTKKSSDTKEINVPKKMNEITELRKMLQNLK